MDFNKPITRRQLLAGGGILTAGLFLGNNILSMATDVMTSSVQPVSSKAKAVIQVWLWGGPPHLDTFDPKPEAGEDYCGPFRNPIETNVKGIKICELLPLLAQQADKYSLIRSMTHGNNGHETAAYMVQAGWPDGGRISHPTLGAIVSKFNGVDSGYKGLIPPYIVLTQGQGRFSEAGFLPAKYQPFITGGNPNAQRFEVEGIVAPGITDERQHNRKDFLSRLDTLGNINKNDPEVLEYSKYQKQAYELILGDAGKVFDLSLEDKEVRDKYGRSSFGQSCLVARRLVQNGIKYVTINYPGWDTHKENFQAMRRMLPELDKGLSSLLIDLYNLGLLDSTIIWCCGEFGRTPKIDMNPPWNGGRGHYGDVFSCLVAGGGFKGGQVIGSSDFRGEKVKERPVYPNDLIGSMCQLLGINPATEMTTPQGQPTTLLPQDFNGKTGGLLKEIM